MRSDGTANTSSTHPFQRKHAAIIAIDPEENPEPGKRCINDQRGGQLTEAIRGSAGTQPSMIYRATGNIRAIRILLGHSKIENTVRYLGVDVEDALLLAERTEI